MLIHPRDSFKNIIKVLDGINPFLIIISIIGLFLEYTTFKAYVLTPNKVISVLFVIDFIIRIISYNPVKYMFKAYGWVDFLASLPGIFFFLDNTPLFAVFKIIKVGRFFKIIRILRFLRVFNFLKKMKADSIWIQDRIMKIGVTIVMIFVCGIIVIDSRVEAALQDREAKIVEVEYSALDKNIDKFVATREDILYYTWDSKLYSRDGDFVEDYNLILDLFSSELEQYLLIMLEDGTYEPVDGLVLPTDGVIIPLGVIGNYQNSIMLALLTTLLIILTVIIFYMGFVFAKDMQIIQLIIDSFDAGDDLLLKQEAESYKDENGELIIDPEENEMISLLKAAANITVSSSDSDDMLMNLAGLGMAEPEITTDNDISYQLNGLEDKLDDRSLYLVEETVKRLTPAIIKYINRELK